MFEKKQNVFDDWFAAAEYLIANKYTSPQHFAITGRSNGGLLMGAAITQRPDLFSAVLCGYPLLDMLRYQKFLVGSYWVTEYGSSDNEKQFPYLLKYSPYQNVKAGHGVSGRDVLHRRQRHARGPAACAQDDGAVAGGLYPADARCCCITAWPAGTRPGSAWTSRSRTTRTSSPFFGLKPDSRARTSKHPGEGGLALRCSVLAEPHAPPLSFR